MTSRQELPSPISKNADSKKGFFLPIKRSDKKKFNFISHKTMTKNINSINDHLNSKKVDENPYST